MSDHSSAADVPRRSKAAKRTASSVRKGRTIKSSSSDDEPCVAPRKGTPKRKLPSPREPNPHPSRAGKPSRASIAISDSEDEPCVAPRQKGAPKRQPPSPRKELNPKKRATTLDYPRFPQEEPDLVAFQDYLTSLDSGKRSPQKATGIVSDVSKFLHFANPGTCQMEELRNDDTLKANITKLEATGIGADGITMKLDRFLIGLRYLSHLHRKECPAYLEGIKVTVTQLQQWKKVFAKGKRALEADRLATFARKELKASDLPKVAENSKVVAFYFNIAEQAKRGQAIHPNDIALATGVVAAMLVFNNLQRVGAVQGMKADEVKCADFADFAERGGHQYLTVHVHEHKTASSGAAPVVAKDGDITILRRYQQSIRPLITSSSEGYFLLTPAGKQLPHLNDLFQRLGKRFGIKFPTATTARKIGATEHARQGCSYSEAASLSRHMGHSLATSKKYYQATVAARDTITAFERIDALGREKPKPSEPRKRRTWSRQRPH